MFRPGGQTMIGILLCFVFLASLGMEVALAAGKTGLPLPRFVSLRKAEVNVRTGPGTRYPVDWVFTRKNMPVEIIAEFDAWRKVKDWEGVTGWVHKSMLSGRRWIIIPKGTRQLRRTNDPKAPVVAHLEQKVIARLKRCQGVWCEINLTGIKGWIKRTDIWGVYRSEKIQ
jgi:SH3-like domain-containing protein